MIFLAHKKRERTNALAKHVLSLLPHKPQAPGSKPHHLCLSALVYTAMIRKNLLNCKLNFDELYAKTIFPAFKEKYVSKKEVCPSCGASGFCRLFASYKRFLIDFAKGRIHQHHVKIFRVKCESCGHTHAILPDFIIPYCQYSMPFILQVLRVYFLREKTVREICDVFDISPQLFYRWLRVFGKHKTWHLGSLASAETNPGVFLDRVISRDPFTGFLSKFHEKTLFTFLQNHANPANCARKPPG